MKKKYTQKHLDKAKELIQSGLTQRETAIALKINECLISKFKQAGFSLKIYRKNLNDDAKFQYIKRPKKETFNQIDYENYYSANKKILINIESGIFYNSIKEGAESHEIKESTLSRQLKGEHPPKTYLRYAN